MCFPISYGVLLLLLGGQVQLLPLPLRLLSTLIPIINPRERRTQQNAKAKASLVNNVCNLALTLRSVPCLTILRECDATVRGDVLLLPLLSAAPVCGLCRKGATLLLFPGIPGKYKATSYGGGGSSPVELAGLPLFPPAVEVDGP